MYVFLFFHSPSVSVIFKDSGIYVPFESFKPWGDLKIYSEQNKTQEKLLLIYEDIKCLFSVGEKTVIVNGKEKMLPEPLILYDGLPMLNLNFICDVWNLSLKEDIDSLKITV